MKKKVIKGWVSRSCKTPNTILGWYDRLGSEELVQGPHPTFKLKGKKDDWSGGDNNNWPPKKVKITIELED
jgi:hypothetical protein